MIVQFSVEKCLPISVIEKIKESFSKNDLIAYFEALLLKLSKTEYILKLYFFI